MISSYRKWMVEFLQKLRNRLHDACDAFPWGFVWFGDLQLQNWYPVDDLKQWEAAKMTVLALFREFFNIKKELGSLKYYVCIVSNVKEAEYFGLRWFTFSFWPLQAVPVMCFRRWMFAWSVKKPVYDPMATWSLPECFVPVTAVERKMPVRYKETKPEDI